MALRRRQQTARLGEEKFGGPADVFFRPSGQRADSWIHDFSPLSETVQGFLKKEAYDRSAELAQQGERYVAENALLVEDLETDAGKIKDPKERDAYLRKSFDWLQKQGVITPAADPYFQIGYARAAARMMAGRYRDRVFARMNEVSVTTGDDGLPGTPADPEAIMAEEWEKIGSSPAVQNFYGGQEALGLKTRVDEEFRARSSAQRAEAIEKEYMGALQREIGQDFDVLLHNNPHITSETLQGITDFVTNEVRGHNVQNPRELVLEGLKLSFQRAYDADPDEAVRAVYAAQDLVIGGVRLGDDRSGVGQQLEELKRRYIEQAKTKDASDVQATENKRRRAIQKAEDIFVPELVKAKREGRDLQPVIRALGERFLQEDTESQAYDGLGGFVVEELEAFGNKYDAARQSDQATISRLNVLIADGRTDEAEALSRSALEGEMLTGDAYAEIKQLIGQRKAASPWVENSAVYQDVRGRYDRSKPQGYTDEVQRKIDGNVVERQRRLSEDFAAFVKTTEGQTDREGAHRQWLEQRWAADNEALSVEWNGLTANRDQLIADIHKRGQRHQDSEDLIAQGESAGVITKTEAQSLRQQNEETAQRERFYGLPEYRDAEAWIETQIVTELATGGQPGLPELQLREEAYEKLRGAYDAKLDEIFADEKVSPRNFTLRARLALREIRDELSDQLFPSARKTVEAGVEGEKSAEEISEQVEHLELDRQTSQAWRDQLATAAGRESLTSKSPLFRRAAAVPESFYEDAALWLSGVDPFFGSPVSRGQVESRARELAIGLAANHQLSDEERQDAAGAIIEVVGITPAEVLKDLAEFRTDPAQAAVIQERLRMMERLKHPKFPPSEQWKREHRALEMHLAGGASVELGGYQYRPFTTPFFRSEAELEAFSSSPDWEPFLQRLGIEPSDDVAVKDFGKAQLAAIDRTR